MKILCLALLLPLASAEVSNRLIAAFETAEDGAAVEAGIEATLKCQTNSQSTLWDSCLWTNPSGAQYTVDADGNVALVGGDGSGFLSADGAGTDENTCAFHTFDLQLGEWTCEMSLTGVTEFQRASVNAISSPRVEDVRIPLDFTPTEYTIYLTPDFDNIETNADGTIRAPLPGSVTAELTASESAAGKSTIYLHAKDMTIWEDTVVVMRGAEQLTVAGFAYDADREFFDIIVSETFSEGDQISVSLSYEGNVRDDLAGLYFSSYQEDGETKMLAVTQFQSTDARKAFPCMDEPALKAVFNVNLGRKDEQGWSSASNKPIASLGATDVAGMPGYVWDEFEPTEVMSTYLVAFLVSQFTKRVGEPFGENDEGDFGVWSRPALYDQLEYAGRIGPRILDLYSSQFEIAFPLPKQDMVALPTLSFGGMENWGLVTYRESYLPYEEGVSSLQYRDSVDAVVAHELAHQWFGDLVTMAWWSDLWLNEGFAEFQSYTGCMEVSPEFNRLERFVLEQNFPAYDLDAYDSSHPVNMEVGHPDEINEQFDDITYEKGASLIRMMNVILTEETFNSGINSYLNEYKYSNAYQDDLWEQLTLAADAAGTELPASIKTIMDSWTLKKGFPAVSVTRTGASTATVSQSRFLLGERDETDNEVYSWWIPLSYTPVGGDFDSASALSAKSWIENTFDEVEIQLDGVSDVEVPVIFNVQGSGFYRVNYDDDTWRQISESLLSDHTAIHKSSRAQLLGDAMALSRAGSLAYDSALPITEYLNLESDYVPWDAALSSVAYVSLMLSGSDAASYIDDYVEGKIEHLYDELGYDGSDQDTFQEIMLRSLTLSTLCGYDYPECRDRAVDDFQLWTESPIPDSYNPIDSEVKYSTYCTAIRNGDDADWDFLLERFENTDNSDERKTISQTLTCSQNPVTLREYLDYIIPEEHGVLRTDASYIVGAMADNPVGVEVAWEWMQQEWNSIHNILDTAVSSPVARMVDSVTKGFNTEEELAELQAFYDDNFDILGTAQRATETALATVEANIAWMDAHFEEVKCWLQQEKGEQCTTQQGDTGASAKIVVSSLTLIASLLFTML